MKARKTWCEKSMLALRYCCRPSRRCTRKCYISAAKSGLLGLRSVACGSSDSRSADFFGACCTWHHLAFETTMDEPLDLVLARSSPLRDRSNEALLVEAYKTPKKRRSLGGEDGNMEPPVSRMKNDVGRRRRPSAGSPQESDPRPLAEAEMMSFDEMRKQLGPQEYLRS
eukprot:s2560_g8.t1